MPFKLIPPGQRKGNRFYLVRGTHEITGERVEISTKTTNEEAALRFKAGLELRLLETRVPSPGEELTFADAERLYRAARRPAKSDERRLDRIRTTRLATKMIGDVIQADIDAAADELCHGLTNETRNRDVYTPIAAVLHYAEANRWRGPIRIARPKLKDAETRAAAPNVPGLLLGRTAGTERLLILWLFKHGSRISDALRQEWPRIDLERGVYEQWIAKAGRWKTFALDDEVAKLLRRIPKGQRTGRLFPWRSRWRVYEWLRPLVKELGVEFTPHMARHWLGKALNREGAGLRTIMDALGQSSPKAALRYMAEDVEVVREVRARIARIGGMRGGKRRLSA